MTQKFLIVGLGNPGREYEKTRHNAGFWVIDELVTRHNLGTPAKERKSLVFTGNINGKSVVLAKPQTYMNLSGEATRALMDYYRIPIENVLVIHDDLDTPVGVLRLRKSGGHGGQNGIRNILLHLGSDQFARVRFGIGRPPGKMQAVDYVLQAFSGDDAITIQQVIDRSVSAVESWLKDGIEITMTQFNGDINETAVPKTNLAEELQLAERAHELAPRDIKPLEALTRLYRRAEKIDAAIEAHLKLAKIYADNEKPKQMLHEWDNVVRLRPSMVDLQIKIAQENETQGDSKRATQAWLRLAEYHIAQNNPQQATEAIEQALRINPQHPRALEMKQSLLE
jgi:peptidyl-tRNA hydrolase, PTH1 family